MPHDEGPTADQRRVAACGLPELGAYRQSVSLPPEFLAILSVLEAKLQELVRSEVDARFAEHLDQLRRR